MTYVTPIDDSWEEDLDTIISERDNEKWYQKKLEAEREKHYNDFVKNVKDTVAFIETHIRPRKESLEGEEPKRKGLAAFLLGEGKVSKTFNKEMGVGDKGAVLKYFENIAPLAKNYDEFMGELKHMRVLLLEDSPELSKIFGVELHKSNQRELEFALTQLMDLEGERAETIRDHKLYDINETVLKDFQSDLSSAPMAVYYRSHQQLNSLQKAYGFYFLNRLKRNLNDFSTYGFRDGAGTFSTANAYIGTVANHLGVLIRDLRNSQQTVEDFQKTFKQVHELSNWMDTTECKNEASKIFYKYAAPYSQFDNGIGEVFWGKTCAVNIVKLITKEDFSSDFKRSSFYNTSRNKFPRSYTEYIYQQKHLPYCFDHYIDLMGNLCDSKDTIIAKAPKTEWHNYSSDTVSTVQDS